MMSAYPTLARLHRAGRAPQHHQSDSHPVVRAYVLPPDQHRPALPVRQFMETSR